MHPVLVCGAGQIGQLIACLLSESGDYQVFLSDMDISKIDKGALGSQQENIELISLDVNDRDDFSGVIKHTSVQTLISCLPYFCNNSVAEYAKQYNLNYFDLTEDVKVTQFVQQVAEGSTKAFVPQCGLAPGFISIAANDLIKKFDTIDLVQMRVGALPIHSINFLKYALNWSTDGLINEYGNDCIALQNGKIVRVEALEGLETIEIDGLIYEAFNTSGGLGSLPNTYEGKVQTMNYKTVRYPGHCEVIKLLMNDLKLNQDRKTLKRLLEDVIPRTNQDVVLIFASVKGHQDSHLMAENYFKKVYPADIADKRWSAIQVTTATSICAVLDIVLQDSNKYQGLVLQEDISLSEFLNNRFGRYYA